MEVNKTNKALELLDSYLVKLPETGEKAIIALSELQAKINSSIHFFINEFYQFFSL